jgi:acyl transferase domain-containing protein
VTDVPYKPEEQVLKRIEQQQQAEMQRELERKVVEAKPASGSAAFKPEPASENEKLKLAVADRSFEPVVEAEAKLSKARDMRAPRVPEIDVAQAGDATKQSLSRKGLLNRPLSGDDAEKYAKTVLEKEGLSSAKGSRERLLGVTEGQFSGRQGIDLVGVSEKHRPVPIEVKKIQQSQAHLNDKPLTSVESRDGRPVKQMDDTWTRDRYRRLIESPKKRKELWEEGVGAKYLNPRNLARNDAKLWSDILPEKTVITVSPQGEKAIGPKLLEQTRDRDIRRVVSIKTLA